MSTIEKSVKPFTPRIDCHITFPYNIHTFLTKYSTLSGRGCCIDLTLNSLNPLAPMKDQDRISPYIFNITSSRQVMRIKRNIT